MNLRSRLLAAAGLLVVALSAIGYSLIVTVEKSQIRQTDNQLRATVPIAAGLARNNQPPDSGSPSTLPSPDARGQGLSDTYVAVITAGNRQIFASPSSAKGQQPDLPSVTSVSASSLHAQTVPSLQGSSRWRAVLLRTPNGSRVLVAIYMAPIDATASDLRFAVIAAGLSVAVILIVSGFWVERLGLRPLAHMKSVAEAIVRGDRSRRAAEAPAKGEAAHLARAFNVMLDQQKAIEDQLRQFVSDASHELRTPTAVVSGVTQLWRRGELRDGGQLDEAMRRIGQASGRMHALVEELLLLARLDEGGKPRHESVDVADMLRGIQSDALSTHPSRQVQVDVSDPVVIYGDPESLRRVMSNLVTNALVHTPGPSRIVVSAASVGESVVLAVADRGPGMEQADADRAFDRFWRGEVSRTRPGSGLGLSIVSAIVHAHGGAVNLETSVTGGTTVRVVLPAHAPTRMTAVPPSG